MMQIKSLVLLAIIAVALDGPIVARAPVVPAPLAPLFAPDQGEPRAAILLDDGRVVAKHYAPGYSDATRFISWSTAKTMTAMLVGELVADGRLALDAPAPIAEWHHPGDGRAHITLRQLLNMTSGLRHIEEGQPVERSDAYQVLFVGGTRNMAARAIAQPLSSPPGRVFEYSSLTTIILAEIIARTLTTSHDPRRRAALYREFAETRLFRPAGVTSAVLEFDGAGTQIGGSILYMSLPDYARLGGLLYDGRGVDGTQIIRPDWLAFMETGSPANPNYGGQTWLDGAHVAARAVATKVAVRPATVTAMHGHLGQYVTSFSGRGTDGKLHQWVLVRLGKTNDPKLGPVRAAVDDVILAQLR
ncbi:MAG: serine hydrolase domain-containing protein [Sphingomonas sp.]